MRIGTFLLFTAAAVLAGPCLRTASPGPQYGTQDQPLDGQRCETLRDLARHLDETARGALEGATDDAKDGTSSAARFLPSIRSFARSADAFRFRMDAYPTSPFEVAAHVDDLTTQAHAVSDQIRSAQALASTYDDWEAVRDVLGRMSLLLAGGDVEVPAAHVVAALSGSQLQQFRQLAYDVDLSATRAHTRAERDVGDYRKRGRQFLGELRYFATQSRDLRDRADAASVLPQQIGPLVDLLLEDARQADRNMRDAQVFTSVWSDSGWTITMLQRMTNLVRSRHQHDEAGSN